MRPPQLHVVFVSLDGFAFEIFKIKYAAVVVVPAEVDRVIENLFGELEQFLVVGAYCLVHQKPAKLYRMTGIDDPRGGGFAVIFALQSNRFQHERGVFITESVDVLYEFFGFCRISSDVVRYGFHQDRGNVQQYHRNGERFCVARARYRLGRYLVWIRRRVAVHFHDEIVIIFGALSVRRVAGRFIVFGTRNDIEALREHIPSFSERSAVARNLEKHSAVRIDTVRRGKIDGAFSHFQPFAVVVLGKRVVQTREHISAPALHPDAFIGGIDVPLPVQTAYQPAVLGVGSVIEPERYARLEQLFFKQIYVFGNFHALPPQYY